jgi:uncharacterized protein (DUF305 family)
VKRYLTIFMLLALSTLLSGCKPMMRHAHAMMEHWQMHHEWMMDHEGMMGQKGMEHKAMANGTIPTATVSFDAQFIDSMIEHHQGAIAMAEQVLTESERPELLAMAEAIIAAQGQEIEQMQEWRTTWYPELAPSQGMEMAMGQMSIDDDETIPFDQRFLTAMIDHHQGAIHMAEMALAKAEHAELKTLSEAIIAAQQVEIEGMQGWLQEWFDIESK